MVERVDRGSESHMTDVTDGQGRWVKPLWFGPEDRPLFGWVHAPASGQVRGAVVLAPTLGIEAVNARYAYKDLADALADAGFAAIRFDYDGTGDSAGVLDDPGRVDAWLHSLRTAIELVKGLALGRVSVVGLRIGATLAAEVLGSGPASIDDLVLWDPCASGRTFLREQSALWSFALGAERVNDGSIETPGMLYSPDTASRAATDRWPIASWCWCDPVGPEIGA
jgi:alpha-beta hydrolase superfamily lysophospholipase